MLKNFIFKESLGKEYPEQELNRSIATFANFFWQNFAAAQIYIREEHYLD